MEPHVRRLVAEHLGVGVEELVSEVSLRDDLAADSLDLVELALALEGEFPIAVPERILDEVRSPRIWARIVPTMDVHCSARP